MTLIRMYSSWLESVRRDYLLKKWSRFLGTQPATPGSISPLWVEENLFWDLMGMLRQIGVLPGEERQKVA